MRADVSNAKKIMTIICVPETQKFLSPASGRSSSPHQQLRHVVSTGWNVPDFTSQWTLEPQPQRDGGFTRAVTWEQWRHSCNVLGWETAVGFEATVRCGCSRRVLWLLLLSSWWLSAARVEIIFSKKQERKENVLPLKNGYVGGKSSREKNINCNSLLFKKI